MNPVSFRQCSTHLGLFYTSTSLHLHVCGEHDYTTFAPPEEADLTDPPLGTADVPCPRRAKASRSCSPVSGGTRRRPPCRSPGGSRAPGMGSGCGMSARRCTACRPTAGSARSDVAGTWRSSGRDAGVKGHGLQGGQGSTLADTPSSSSRAIVPANARGVLRRTGREGSDARWPGFPVGRLFRVVHA
jgi:hypothetical protein